MKSLTIAIASVVASFVASAPASAWTLLAERQVLDRPDRDIIVLPGPRRFAQLRVCVYRKPIHFYDMDVSFLNGGKQDVPLRERINPQGCTRNIDLNGGMRDITAISFLYEEASWRSARGWVRVFGR